jgi:hypothetical protein
LSFLWVEKTQDEEFRPMLVFDKANEQVLLVGQPGGWGFISGEGEFCADMEIVCGSAMGRQY